VVTRGIAAVTAVAVAVLAAGARPDHADRIKDVATVQGLPPNPLPGLRLVVGPAGPGHPATTAG